MKCILYLFLSLFISSNVFAYQFNLGEEIVVQELFWRRLPDGDGRSCQLQFLSKLTVINISAEEILVKYNSDRLDHPANCRNDITLSFEPHYLDTHRDLYKVYVARKVALKNIKIGNSVQSHNGFSVREKLGVLGWSWVIVEEPSGKFREGDLCRIINPSIALIEGFYPEKSLALLSYHQAKSAKTLYQECPENTLFFDNLWH